MWRVGTAGPFFGRRTGRLSRTDVSILPFQFSGLYAFAHDARALFADSNDDVARQVAADSEDFSDCGTAIADGDRVDEEVDVGLLERNCRCAQAEAGGVIGIIRDVVDANRFTAFSSIPNGVVTAQWGDIPLTSIYY